MRTLSILLFAFLLTIPDAAVAQTPCGETVTVTSGDTILGIARRCETTLTAILTANPSIDDPNHIRVGQTLRLRGMPDGERVTGIVTAHPTSGPPGTMVRLRASGFPPFSVVSVGVGRQASEYDLVRQNLRTNGSGSVITRVAVPDYATAGEPWFFVVEAADRRARGRSDPFTVTGGSSGLTIQGTLTDEGVECRALRGDDGKLYTLSGGVDFAVGERVEVRGTPVEISTCMQGTTIRVLSIRQLR